MSESITILALNNSENGLERFKLNASKALTVDGSASTQPVSGTFYQATQPVSGSVAVSGVSGSVTVDGSGVTQPVSGTVAVSGVSGSVVVDGSGVTQPVSGSVSITGNVSTVGGVLSVANTSHFAAQSIAAGLSAQSSSQDISSAHKLVLYGDTDNLTDEVGVQISFNNSDFYDMGLNLYPDSLSGNIVREIETSAKYIRINKLNASGSAETITLSIMVKN